MMTRAKRRASARANGEATARTREAHERAFFEAECIAARVNIGGARSHGRCVPDNADGLFAGDARANARERDPRAYDGETCRVEGRTTTPYDDDVERLRRVFPDVICDNVRKCGMATLTVVQRWAMPLGAAGADVLCNAPTGSGKTAAFVLPLVARLVKEDSMRDDTSVVGEEEGTPAKPRVLILVPTRELAMQIHVETRRFIFGTNLWAACAYGGSSIKPQLEELSFAPDVLIATPGRLLTMAREKFVDLSRVESLVLDEADRMLDMGFEPQLRELLQDHGMPKRDRRQTMMFSATFPQSVLRLAGYYLRAPPDAARVIVGRVGATVKSIEQNLIEVPPTREGKLPYLCDALKGVRQKCESDGIDAGLTLIFVKEKSTCTWLRKALVEQNPSIAVEELHGDLTQGARLRALEAFATGKATYLVATDIAARGLDLPTVNHVVNFDLPTEIRDFDDYVHRIGRTGRAGRTGLATSLYSPGFERDVGNGPIHRALKQAFEENNQLLPVWFRESPDRSGPSSDARVASRKGFRGGRVRRF